MKKSILAASLVLMMSAALGVLTGCRFSGKSEGIDVVCTIFPQYSWVKSLAEGNNEIQLTILQDSGTDLHSYQPTAADKVKILSCDLLVYVGGASDQWVEDMLKDPAVNPELRIVKLLDEVDALDEEDVPGGEEHEEEGGEHDHEEGEKDEHVWLSPRNAQKLVKTIAKVMQSADPQHEALYETNLRNYLSKLDALEQEYDETIKSAARKVLLFGDRFPFRYLIEDYGLAYYAAFSGCSAETEASFETIIRLAEAVDSNNLPYILVLEGSKRDIAEQIKSNTKTKDQTILVINSIQSITKKQIEDGADYLSLMRENLNTLEIALN